MTRIRFEDLPSTNTPRNAENLNKLNNVVISSTEPTTGEEVWIDDVNKKMYIKNDFDEYKEFATSDIIESGSNANGSWIKYIDGRMECRHKIVGNAFDCSKKYGAYYFYKDVNDVENDKHWTFPQPFVSTEGLIVQVTVGSSAYVMSGTSRPTTSTVYGYCVIPYPVSNVTFEWSFTAIGRWK